MPSSICWVRFRIRPASCACRGSAGATFWRTGRAGSCSSIKASPLSRSTRRPRSDHPGARLSHAPCCCGVRFGKCFTTRSSLCSARAKSCLSSWHRILQLSPDRHTHLKVFMTARSAISRTSDTSRKPASSKGAATGKANRKSSGKPRSAKLPEWNLTDLYSGIDAPEITRDLTRLDAECVAFETDYKGTLAEQTAKEDGGKWLAEAVRRYEAIEDLAGRLGSYAGLVHAGDSVDPAISKFYGDVSERLTNASVHLLFFALELNRVDDAIIDRAMQTPELAHYRPWIEDLRKDKPYQLEDRVEQLFHEKSQSGYAAWNRLFDQTISGLRFKVGAKELAIEPTLNFLQDRAPEKRKAAGQALAKTFKDNERTFALITNTLAKDKEISDRWRGFADVADSRQ